CEQRAFMIDRTGPLAGFVQDAVAIQQYITGQPWRSVNQEWQDVHLHVPEVMPVVRLAGQPLGRNTGVVGPSRRLEQLEQVPAQALLPALMLGVEADV